MTTQLQLFHQKALIQYPRARPTAVSLNEVELMMASAISSGDAHGKATRASEWLGTHLAESVGISDVEPLFTCQACDRKGADVRPDFGWEKAARRTTISG